ncbi:MAG: molybdate transport system substrate-binding protein [Arenicella sp.]|jgi:molybdate transport system substrate-binding protein
MRHVFGTLVVCLFSTIVLTACQPQQHSSSSILVFAAASLRDVMEEIGTNFQQKTGTTVRFNFGGSNMLARQIEFSRKADVFLSANILWVDYLADKELLIESTKQPFLSNSLVFIANSNSQYELASAQDVMNLSFRFFSIGDPKAVPAGSYAKAYLSSVRGAKPNQATGQSVWRSLENKILPAPDVRAATAAVAAMPDIIGMVYKTDALAYSGVRILFDPLVDEAPEVQYFAALINRRLGLRQKHDGSDIDKSLKYGAEFLNFLSVPESRFIFRKYGFIAPNTVSHTALEGSGV